MPKKFTSRYNTHYSAEGEFEPCSRNRVLKNLLGITKKRQMDMLEWDALQITTNLAIDSFHPLHQFTANDILNLHKTWLGEIYPWAGQYRNVNTSKDNFHFAAANQIKKLMSNLETNEMKQFTPCKFKDITQATEAIAVVHTELILIHPFRDGNGRIIRLLSSLMALQAGLPLLDFGGIKGKQKQNYFSAVQAGLNRDYEPMIRIFMSVIKRSLKLYS